MARIRPFAGLRYRLDDAQGDAAQLLAPPYDVVDADMRAELGERHAHNCVHVILPQGEGDAKYPAGAAAFQKLVDEALVQDDAPGFYVYHQRFELGGQSFVRRGFVTLVELTRFGAGPVLPHERTLSGPKADRLKLMRACDAHLELVFGLFSDPDKSWEQAVGDHLGEAVLDCEYDGAHHTLFRVSDPAACEALQAVLADRSIYIADGHHRYETMCTFGDELAAAGRGDGAAKWGMIYLSNLDDDGLVVLPTHRIVHGLEGLDLGAALASVEPYFDVSSAPLADDVDTVLAGLRARGERGAAFGLCVPGSAELHTLTLRADFDPAAAGLGDLPEALQRLDVALLHELVLERALGISKADQAAKKNLRYYKSSQKAIERARDGAEGTQLVCFMNATPVADVVAVCDSGEVMPQKSTFFFPKIPTGLVFHRLANEG